MPSEGRHPNFARYCALMPVWVALLLIVTAKMPHEMGAYRLFLAIEVFMLGWGVGLGRAALATNRGEGRATPIVGLILNAVFFVLLALNLAKPAAPLQLPTTVVEPQSGRASDR